MARYRRTGLAARATALIAATALLVGSLASVAPAMAEPRDATFIEVSRALVARSGAIATTTADSTSAVPVPVDPRTAAFREELARRQARLEELKAQLDELDRQLAVAAESYNQASDQLTSFQEQLSITENDLENAKLAYDRQSRMLTTRVGAMYRDGDLEELSAMGVILGSKSLSDFVSRLAFLRALGENDAGVAAQMRAQRDAILRTAADLKDSKQQAEGLEFSLHARQIEITLRIEERQELLANAQADLLKLLDEEASRRSQEEAALLRAILSGVGKAGIPVEPNSVVETALSYHGVPYLWGGATPAAFDCSGLVLYVFGQHGVILPHYSGSQFLLGTPVQYVDLLPGDVVFFGSPIHHVGIYIGGGYFVHAPRTGDFVKVSLLADRSDFAGARRYPWVPRVGPVQGAETVTTTPAPAAR
ncbi:MAG: NlpC/P60 family protein [Coriobacteriia bacterium]